MRQNGIQVIRSRKFKRTTDSDHILNIAPYLLQQDFTASGPNQKWAGDIPSVRMREGWVYLAVIMDMFSRRVLGWALNNRMKQDLALQALNMAIAIRRLHGVASSKGIAGRKLRPRLSESAAQARVQGFDEWQGQLLRSSQWRSPPPKASSSH